MRFYSKKSFQNIESLTGKSAKGQKPFIELNGRQIADTSFIIDELEKYFKKNLSENLSEMDRAIGGSQAIVFEQSLVWYS